ncbi:uncharacterized protein LOC118364989 [Oncorhynchus keta]|uniref:uncharacterized protein LOC118364989 n=1 Tax=Oncorhynchus keta TaxID=8018 RepID=UPI00227C3777|nr:uncharacterized protein LOC118364989 [Oncorhynchus keta]
MKMQMLLVLAVAVLMVPSLSEGRILSKCELKSLLEEAAFKFNLTEKARENYLTNKDFVAKIVCHVEKATGFNTSFVTPWRDDDDSPTRPAKDDNRPTRPTHPEHPPRRGKRHAGDSHGDSSTTESHQFSPSKEDSRKEDSSKEDSRKEDSSKEDSRKDDSSKEDSRKDDSSKEDSSKDDSSKEDSSKEDSSKEDSRKEDSSEEETMRTLYGLFQLSDRVICASGSTPSLNLCQMNCSDLIDDDISDDLDCVETIKQTVESGPRDHKMALMRMFKLLFQKECVMTDASSYFSEC